MRSRFPIRRPGPVRARTCRLIAPVVAPVLKRPHGYDLGMEILSSLPYEGRAWIEDLATELGMSERSIRRELEGLTLRYPVCANERNAWISMGGRARIKAVTERYWAQVYERNLD